MPSPYSPYVAHEAASPKWNMGEKPAASAFIGMTLLLAPEVNIEVFRTFKRRTGLYYWSITIGSLACGVDAIGIILKFLTPHTQNVWILYLLLVSIGWATFTVAQLLVLYSRLHLVTEDLRLRRKMLLMICVISPIVIIADWTVLWPAWNTWNQKLSDKWSPYHAIVERSGQLAFTCVELIISGVYIHALGRLLSVKSSVRQRRVMWDLKYVVILGVIFDVINVVLVFVNRIALSHPIQVFTYALKLRLMAVATRGLHRKTESFAEKRYHDPDAGTQGSSPAIQQLGVPSMNHFDTPVTLPSVPDAMADRFIIGLTHHQEGQSPSQENMPPVTPGRPKNRTLWRNDEDSQDEDEEEKVKLEQWEYVRSGNLQIPWFLPKKLEGKSGEGV
ncbi:MAG: hypothetical protein Q9219_004660 [cf. Caloplaca sp. 3 TL-2023]